MGCYIYQPCIIDGYGKYMHIMEYTVYIVVATPGIELFLHSRPEPADLESLLSSLKSPREDSTALSSKDMHAKLQQLFLNL